MLEVVGLSKIYKTKGGADVRALDDVSLRFPEKGMVFLLGKSGSGKSTLLNVCGGLDNPTSGEIIVKGRSSKNFSQSDFDSYRNTFIGFIFQEYNILNEFSVEDNIALALELQGKSKDKEAIAAILEQVDLTGYAKRKPNTLSGGQKQRIAIARALIKTPEIIMADEPTGALDSSTGKQVFDTLKKLSKDKLVIVVSHDREFAEQYGDRVIELKDGKILSDVSKTNEEQVSLSENVVAIGETLCIKSGAELSDTDFKEIKAFLKKSEKNVIIASGEKDVKNFKEVSRINDDGQKEIFRETDEAKLEKKAYAPEDSKFIRSKLPMRHAVKIGVSGLKTKPFRLFFTIILCTVSFVLFGLLSTMTFYDSTQTLKQTLKDSSLSSVRLEKEYQLHVKYYTNGIKDGEYEREEKASFTAEEVDSYAQIYGENTFGAVKNERSFSVQTPSKYWKNSINYYAYLPENHSLRSNLKGDYPLNENEIAISSYTANVIKECKSSEMTQAVEEIEDLIGQKLTLNGEAYKIVGIFETPELSSKYDELKESSSNYSLINEYENTLTDGYYLLSFVSEDQFEKIVSDKNHYSSNVAFNNRDMTVATSYNSETGEYEYHGDYSNGYYAPLSKKSAGQKAYWIDSQQTSLSGVQAIVSQELLYELLNPVLERTYWEEVKKYQESGQPKISSRLETYDPSIDTYVRINRWESGETEAIPSPTETELYEIYTEWKKAYAPVENAKAAQAALYVLYVGHAWDDATGDQIFFTATEIEEMREILRSYLAENDISISYKAKLFDSRSQIPFGEEQTFTIVGFFNGDYRQMYLSDEKSEELWKIHKGMIEYYSEETTAYVADENAVYDTIFLPYDRSDALTDQLVKIYKNQKFNAEDVRICLESSLVDGFKMADNFVGSMSEVFLWLGLVMAVFAALLLSNFISVSISNKKKEIGILRAVGARSVDVFKIFFSESFTITAICTVLGIVGSVILCDVINGEIVSMIGASLFVFGFYSILILLGVALLTSVISTFLPVWNAAKKKPVESIRAL